MGMLKDDISLSLLYAACDVFTAPSIEDNLPNTIMEAMACGTPCASFNTGGISDMISHKKNGILASPLDTRDLAEGIYWILSDWERRKKLSLNAVEKVKKSYAIGKVAKQYLDVYNAALK